MGTFRTSGYDKVLLNLRAMAVELAEALQNHLSAAIEALEKGETVQDWEERDDIIDQMRDCIVKRSFDIMSLQQLRSQDLRWILGFQRMAQELERVADYACDLAELSELKPEGNWSVDILQMAKQLTNMTDYTVAILKGEQEITLDLADQDDVLDKAYASFKAALVKGSQEKCNDGQLGLSLVVARTIERMGDHIVNVAETLLYVQTGSRRVARAGS
ncbi:phosphate signaling complex PhoU family protein [Desulfosporosinus metallidurans]|uniref:Phosphate transport system regulatory protein PhoU n=1 Tax=Desulfosporosinus metallidurans TaxID=1888891 RepID=A0A1Q8R2X4_9FIRM|nr:PhoU domain-containing protein [Desulfosporosinus metallidurans]OLN33851.1 Phosphate transport system regulatory protein PhoU [Desulfosporosinus metallidurans]